MTRGLKLPQNQTMHDALIGTWWYVPEQDTAGESVYRKDGVDLPPARGRRGFTLSADGSAILLAPGPTDRRSGTPGQWALDASGQLHVTGASQSPGPALVVTLSADRLALRK